MEAVAFEVQAMPCDAPATLVFRVVGDLDMMTCPALLDQVKAALPGSTCLILDLSELTVLRLVRPPRPDQPVPGRHDQRDWLYRRCPRILDAIAIVTMCPPSP